MHMHDELYKDCVQKHEIDSPTEGKNSPICVYFIIEIKRNHVYMCITCLICKIRPYLNSNNNVHVKITVYFGSCTTSGSQGEAKETPHFKERTLKSR